MEDNKDIVTKIACDIFDVIPDGVSNGNVLDAVFNVISTMFVVNDIPMEDVKSILNHYVDITKRTVKTARKIIEKNNREKKNKLN